MPEAELKRVLGEGGVHGLEEAGDHVEGSWEDNIFCLGVVSQKKQHIVALVVQNSCFCFFVDSFFVVIRILRSGQSEIH